MHQKEKNKLSQYGHIEQYHLLIDSTPVILVTQIPNHILVNIYFAKSNCKINLFQSNSVQQYIGI